MDTYILDQDGRPVMVEDLTEWAKWMSEDKRRFLKRTEVAEATVSTVFLGIDHNFLPKIFPEGSMPILYETMIFKGKEDGFQERYCTEAEALSRHDEIVRWLQVSPPQGVSGGASSGGIALSSSSTTGSHP
jgi:hypothetical protein